jgi:Concanavalin A-like lectin/glucanases superfamily
MNKPFKILVTLSSALILAGIQARADYSNTLMSLSPPPVGYWPLQERVAPPTPYATNLGTFGPALNGQVGMWWQPIGGVGTNYYFTNQIRLVQGATYSDDADMAMYFTGNNAAGQYIAWPRNNTNLVLRPPWSIEAWVQPTNLLYVGGFHCAVSQGRVNDLGPAPDYSSRASGFSLGEANGGPIISIFNNNNNGGYFAEIDVTNSSYNNGNWNHLVATFDGTTLALYVNGAIPGYVSTNGHINGDPAVPGTPGYAPNGPNNDYYEPNLVDPLIIGGVNGSGLGSGWQGFIDEVAIYTNALTPTQIATHYANRNSGYKATVLLDNPAIYVRMDGPSPDADPNVGIENGVNITAASAALPVAHNFGTLGAALNGHYLPGALPSSSGLPFAGMGAFTNAVGFNGLYGGIDIGSGGNLTNTARALVPANGVKPVFSLINWFQGYPADSLTRFQGLSGRGDQNWRTAMDGNYTVHQSPGNGNEVQPANLQQTVTNGFLCNDGLWHMQVAVSDGTNGYEYIDGVLASAFTASENALNNANSKDLWIGDAPDFTTPGNNRSFAGRLAHVAYFTNVLSAATVSNLYAAAQVPPFITYQSQSLSTFTNYAAAFNVTAGGSGPLSYQWYLGVPGSATPAGGGDITGAATGSLQFTSAATSDSGNYFLVVSNPYGSVTSSVVSLNVSTALPTDPWAQAILALNPAGYWPLTETTQPTNTLYKAHNLGSLGIDGLYETWYPGIPNTLPPVMNSANYHTNNQQMADGDTAMVTGTSGQYVVFPRTANGSPVPALTIQPPFVIELWVNPATNTGGTFGLVSEGRNAIQGGQNTGYNNVAAGFFLGANGANYIFDVYNTNGTTQVGANDFTLAIPRGQINNWAILAVSFDGSNETFYVNGSVQTNFTFPPGYANAAGQFYVPDPISPLIIGGGPQLNGGLFPGRIDEVAIYTNLSVIPNLPSHPSAAGSGNYQSTILADHPLIYCRLGEADYTAFSPGALPVCTNYGSLGSLANGVYKPGTVPGLAGPPIAGFTSGNHSVAMNGMNAFVDIGAGSGIVPPSLNPIGTNRLTITAWFKANPADANARFENILGHSDASWRLAMDGNGLNRYNSGNGPELAQSIAGAGNNGFEFNDGNWHFIAAVSDTAQNYLYLDGRLAFQAGTEGSIGGSLRDVVLGGDPQYTTQGGRIWDGSIAQVAFFNTTLTAAQIQTLYNAAGVPPYMVLQPESLQTGLATNTLNSGTTNFSLIAAASGGVNQDYLATVAIATGGGGTNYSTNDLLTLSGGAGVPAVVKATVNSNGVITAVTIVNPGNYTVAPPSPNSPTGGTGSNAVLNLTFSAGLAYQWYHNGTLIPGATSTNLVPAGTLTTPIGAANAGTYQVVVTNNYGSVTSLVSLLNVNTNPIITAQPFPTTTLLYAGSSAFYSLGAIGGIPLYYFWQSNGVFVAGATNSSFSPTNIQSTVNYSCTVSNSFGTTNSAVVTVTIVALPPTNTYAYTVIKDHPVGYWRLNEAPNSPPNNGTIANDLVGGHSGLYSNAIIAQPTLNTFDPSSGAAGFGSTAGAAGDSMVFNIQGINFGSPTQTIANFTIEAWAKGTTVTQAFDSGIVTKGFGGGGEEFNLDCGNNDPNHSWRFFMRDAGGGTHLVGAPAGLTSADAQWHHLVGIVDSNVRSNVSLYVDGNLIGTAAYSTANGVLNTTANFPVTIGARQSAANVDDNLQFNGYISDVAIYNYALTVQQVTNHYFTMGIVPTVAIKPPYTPGNPFTTNVAEGSTTVVSTAISPATLPLSYQWYDVTSGSPGTPIPGETNSTLAITNIQAAAYNGHIVSLTITNVYGSVTSTNIQFNVIFGPPTFLVDLQPPSLTVYSNTLVNYSVQAVGDVPFTYQWYQDSVAIANATNSSVAVRALMGAHSYFVAVTNSVGNNNSATVTLTGIAAPTDAYATAVLADAPMAYWRLDETGTPTVANDYVGGHNGTYTQVTNGLPGFSPNDAELASGFGFLATNDSVVIENTNITGIQPISFATSGSAAFSVECWVNAPPGQNTDGAGVCSKGAGGGGEQWSLDAGNGGIYRFFVRQANNAAPNANAGVVVGPDGLWHHLVCVCDEANSNLFLYVDGLRQGSGTALPGTGLQPGSGDPVTIGARIKVPGDPLTDQLITSTMADVALYNYALSSNQVKAHFTAAAQPPVIVTQPGTNVAVYAGRPVNVSVRAEGALPLAYQWTINGSPLLGATNSALSFTAGPGANPFFAIITNVYGSATTVVGTVFVESVANFHTNGPGWSLNGNSGGGFATNLLTITTNDATGLNFSTWFSYPQYVGAFYAFFTYQEFQGTGGADGTAFVIQNQANPLTALGGGGGSLGYSGITPSVALELNIYNPNSIGMAFDANGVIGPAPYASTAPCPITSGNPIDIGILYLNGQASINFTDEVTLAIFSTNVLANIPSILGTNVATIGFTGADGGVRSRQTVTNFVFIPFTGLTAKTAAGGASVTLSWPSSIGGYVLQSNSNVNNSAGWTTVGAPVIVVSGQNTVTVPASAGQVFYRLQLIIIE